MSRRHLFRIQAALILIPVLVTGTFATTLTRQINLVDLVGESQLWVWGWSYWSQRRWNHCGRQLRTRPTSVPLDERDGSGFAERADGWRVHFYFEKRQVHFDEYVRSGFVHFARHVSVGWKREVASSDPHRKLRIGYDLQLWGFQQRRCLWFGVHDKRLPQFPVIPLDSTNRNVAAARRYREGRWKSGERATQPDFGRWLDDSWVGRGLIRIPHWSCLAEWTTERAP